MAREIVGTQWEGLGGGQWDQYLQNYEVGARDAKDWLSDTSNTHWSNYGRSRGGLYKDYFDREPTDYASHAGAQQGQSMWDYGEWHA